MKPPPRTMPPGPGRPRANAPASVTAVSARWRRWIRLRVGFTVHPLEVLELLGQAHGSTDHGDRHEDEEQPGCGASFAVEPPSEQGSPEKGSDEVEGEPELSHIAEVESR